MKIRELSLYCKDIERVSSFYIKNMGLSASKIDEQQIRIKIGESSLSFKYHNQAHSDFLAFSIQLPGNKIREAKNYFGRHFELLENRVFSDFDGKRSVQAFGINGPNNTHIELHAFPEIYNPSQEPFGNRHLLNIDSVVFPVTLVEPMVELLEKTGELKSAITRTEDACAIGTPKNYLHIMSLQKASEIFGIELKKGPDFGVKIETNDRILELIQIDSYLQINEL